jgi:plasmid stabilization system protein ParE
MVRWTARAVTDLVAIGDYIARDKPAAARSWGERLRQRALRAVEMPHASCSPSSRDTDCLKISDVDE